MTITKEEVARIATLSRLSFSEEESEHMRKDLEKIVGYIDLLADVDVSAVEPMVHSIANKTKLREDLHSEKVVGTGGISGSASFEDGLVKVPRIIE